MGMRLLTLTFAAIAGSLWLATTTTAQAQTTEGPGRGLRASNNLKLSADTPRSTTSSFLTELKRFFVPYAGTVRVRWQAKSSDAAKPIFISAHSRVESCFVSISSTVYHSDGCVIRVAAGDLVMIAGGAHPNSPSEAFVRNVGIYYDIVNFDGRGGVLVD